jgi:hypothetical protein
MKEIHRECKGIEKGQIEHSIIENLVMNYNVDLSHFTDINQDTLNTWENQYKKEKYSLDVLYEIKPLKSKLLD